MTLKACVNHKDPEFYFAHMQFFSEVDRCGPHELRHNRMRQVSRM